jgi:beta-fructofuranosidase
MDKATDFRNDFNEKKIRALKAIQEATPKAEADAGRPAYHFHSPAQWMDDPNGIIYHRGYYHLMYSLNPFSSEHRAGMVYKTESVSWQSENKDWTGGVTVWGHARSQDLINWEHLPIALYPSENSGEQFCWFGCTVINGEDTPMAIYTSIGPNKRPEDSADQWAALGDSDLITWEPCPSNPILSESIHGKTRVIEWRDPFIFKEEGRTFLILGGKLDPKDGGEAVISIYEAQNKAYTKWKYRGILFRHTRKSLRSIECPNIAKLGSKWLILLSPHGKVEYFVGQFDLQKCLFISKGHGIVDWSTNFYATNLLFDDKGRCIMWGCIEGFKQTSGWNGCLSLPRIIEISSDDQLIQQPAPELMALRGSHFVRSHFDVEDEIQTFKGLKGNTFEIVVELETVKARMFGIKLMNGKGGLDITFSGDQLIAAGTYMPFVYDGRRLLLHVFLDKSVLEIFINNKQCLTCIVEVHSDFLEVGLFASEGKMRVGSVDVWELVSSELFSFNYEIPSGMNDYRKS